MVVSVVHIGKGTSEEPLLDGKPVQRISAYLVEGDLDHSPAPLAGNSRKAFIGSFVHGVGFTFDDKAAVKGEAETLEAMHTLIAKDPRNAERISPYIGGEEVNSDPRHAYHRFVIDFFDRPLRRDSSLKPWIEMDHGEVARCRAEGVVPADYPDEVAEDWPDLIEIVRRRVKPDRDIQKRKAIRERWWQFADKRPGLYMALSTCHDVLVANAGASPHHVVARLTTDRVFAHTLAVVVLPQLSSLAILQSRIHEAWARFFSSSMKDDLRYTPSDCFRTFPFPENFETHSTLETIGEAYHKFRANLMIERNEGLTKTYNRFHARSENAPDIARLRALHAEMDAAVLRAYGWDDLAERAAPEFIEQDADEGKTRKTRLDWPAEFKDEVLARLLALNAERAAAEKVAGLTAIHEDEEEEIGDFEEAAVA